MIKYSLALLFIVTICFGSSAYAQQCGAGTVKELKEGGWNTDDFMLKLEGPNAGASTLFHGFVRFSSSGLSPSRLEAIRRLATTAFALDAKVSIYSHNGSCTAATEISMLQ